MKKLLAVLLVLTMIFTVVACAKEEKKSESDAKVGEKDLYLITDLGTIDDKSFNQGSYEGLKDFAEENKVSANYIKPADEGDQIYKDAIDQAVADGAKVIVTPGFLFEAAIYEAQDQYPDVHFIAVDFEPSPDFETPAKVADNTISILYKEQEAGFLAGYAVVKDGYTKLGFMGGIAVPAVVNFGLGYLSGAEYAARETGSKVEVKYTYTDSFVAKPEINTLANAWYNSGTEIIFSCGGGILASIAKAAEDNDSKVVGVDVDQVAESKTIVTSAMKSLRSSVYDAVKSVYDGDFKGGQTLRLGVIEGGVQLPDGKDSFDRFDKFGKKDYEAILEKIKENEDDLADRIYSLEDLASGEGLSVKQQMGVLEFNNVDLEVIE